MAKVMFHIVEIFDYASDRPVITEADILAANRLLVTPLDTYSLFDRKSEGEWRIIGRQEDYAPPEDARDIWFSWGIASGCRKSNVFDETVFISEAEWKALPPLSPGGDYDVKRDVAERLIAAVDWSQYETAYGNAAQDLPHFQCGHTPSVPRSLGELFSGDWNRAMQATNDLWAGLCHQHAYVSSAALPAYGFLTLALQEADDKLKVELLDILLGFAACTGRSAETDWEKELREKLKADLPVFAALTASENEDIACFSERIVEELTQKGEWNDGVDTFYTILEEPEVRAIWDRIYEELHFQPSVRVSTPPFRLSAPYLILDLTYAREEQLEKLFAQVPRAFSDCLGEDDWIYALDWQHSGFRYDPRLPVTEHNHWVEDERYSGILGGGYNAYFPDFYPDGDYYFFVQRDLKWGWLGHPWRREIWIFGDPLLDALSPTLEALGFPVKLDQTEEYHGTKL